MPRNITYLTVLKSKLQSETKGGVNFGAQRLHALEEQNLDRVDALVKNHIYLVSQYFYTLQVVRWLGKMWSLCWS